MVDAAMIQREMFDAIKRSNWDKLRSLYHEDYAYRGGDGTEQKGADAGLAVAQTYMTAFPDLSFDVQQQWAPEPDVAVLECINRGTHTADLEGIPSTGKRIEVPYCNVIETKDGKIVRERDYWDNLTLLRQLGVTAT